MFVLGPEKYEIKRWDAERLTKVGHPKRLSDYPSFLGHIVTATKMSPGTVR